MNTDNKNSIVQAILKDIRKSGFSGKLYLQGWNTSFEQWITAYNRLTNAEKISLIQNIANLRFSCQSKNQFFSIAYCCEFLEKSRLITLGIRDYRKTSIEPITDDIRDKICLEARGKSKKTLRQLEVSCSPEKVKELYEKCQRDRDSRAKKVDFLCASGIVSMFSSSLGMIKNLPSSLYQRMKANFFNTGVLKAVQDEDQGESAIFLHQH